MTKMRSRGAIWTRNPAPEEDAAPVDAKAGVANMWMIPGVRPARMQAAEGRRAVNMRSPPRASRSEALETRGGSVKPAQRTFCVKGGSEDDRTFRIRRGGRG